VVVHSAGIQDRDGARLVLSRAAQVWTRLLWIWADGGYAGGLVSWGWDRFTWFLGIVRRDARSPGGSSYRIVGW
jgi:putative transposase